VPLSLGLLLFGTALADALEGNPGALRRTALASALIAATKNEGLFFPRRLRSRSSASAASGRIRALPATLVVLACTSPGGPAARLRFGAASGPRDGSPPPHIPGPIGGALLLRSRR
jgi:hypothetical protein